MLKNKTSTTAYIVAASVVKLSRQESFKKYCAAEMIYLSKAFIKHGKDSFLKNLICYLPAGIIAFIMDKFFVTGMMQHLLCRKFLIERKLDDSIENGVKQVIVMGGGFDTLSLRMAKKYNDVNFFEIDLPNTQNRKIEVLKEIDYLVPQNCHFINADLSQTKLEKVLADKNTFDASLPTLVILEGVLMYLSETEVKNLFKDLYALLKNQLMVIFGAMVISDDETKYSVKMINSILGRLGEGTKWYCPSEKMPKFMENLGYELKEWLPYKKIQAFYRTENEVKNVPEEDENYYFVVKMPQGATNIPINKTPFISVKL